MAANGREQRKSGSGAKCQDQNRFATHGKQTQTTEKRIRGHLTLRLREATREPVLFTNPGATSAVATLDLDYETYSLSAALAAQGFDV